jgi:FkbM family methyltransferase
MYEKTYKYGILCFPTKIQARKFIRKNGTYQEYINIYAKEYVRENSVVLDIGSNIGIFTVSFSKLFPSCQIHSYKPVSYTFSHLSKSVKINKCDNVVLNKFAVSDTNDEQIIHWKKQNLGASSITQKMGDKKETISTKKLDDLNLSNISFIKVDVQEHELNVIEGARETLIQNDLAIVLELPMRNKKEINIHNKCVKFMKSIGYDYSLKIGIKDFIFRKTPLKKLFSKKKGLKIYSNM